MTCLRSDQIRSVARSCPTLRPHESQHARPPCPTPTVSSPRLTSIESVMPSSHLILCCPLLLLPPIPPSIRVFSNESTLRTCLQRVKSSGFSVQRQFLNCCQSLFLVLIFPTQPRPQAHHHSHWLWQALSVMQPAHDSFRLECSSHPSGLTSSSSFKSHVSCHLS